MPRFWLKGGYKLVKKIKIYMLAVLFVLTVLFSAGCGANENKGVAENYIKDFINKNFDKILNNYDYTSSMASVMNDDGLNEVYNKYIAPLNQFKSITYHSTYQGTISYITEFESGSILLRVTFDNKNQISGFHISPYDSTLMPDNVIEKEIKIGNLKYKLKGTLSEPKDNKADTVVILVQGSGATDRDETVGALKPFRDIAWGLSQKGVAVFRYDKRTYTYGAKLAKEDSFTVNDEVIDDVVYAYKKMQNLGYKKIYIAGHSLGGYLMGRLYNELPEANGYIIMAGNVTPLQDIIVTQIKYISAFDGTITPAEQIQINLFQTQEDNINSLTTENKTGFTSSQLMNAPASYWLDLKGYNPIETMKQCKSKILILQGAKDYQVTISEYNKWKSGLAENGNAEFILYNNLNHLFMSSTVMSPDDYNNLNHVDKNVIEDIYSFVSR